jgi:exosortase O
VHLPLGVFGFIAACGLAVVLLRRLPIEVVGHPVPLGPPLRSGAFMLAGLFVFLSLAKSTSAEGRPVRSFQPAELRFPAGWVTAPLALDGKETTLFERNQAQQVGKWRWRAGARHGSLLVVVADSFRSHHAPEVCLAASGHRVDHIRREILEAGVPIKLIDLEHPQASAATWFQSAGATTDSLIDRTLAEFLAGERRWALVSVLFDEPTTLDPSTSALLKRLHAAVGAALATGNRKGS